MHINRWDIQTKNSRIDAYQCENIYWVYILNSWKELSEHFCCYCCHCSLRCVCVFAECLFNAPKLIISVGFDNSIDGKFVDTRVHGAKAKAFPIMTEFVSCERERENVSCKQWHCILMCLFKICWPWPQTDTNRERRERVWKRDKKRVLRWVSVHPII